MSRRNGQATPRAIRCAIYTRKSTEEGLDQAFNSLDAQRESAEAYIASQKNEGWVCLVRRQREASMALCVCEQQARLRRLEARFAPQLTLRYVDVGWGSALRESARGRSRLLDSVHPGRTPGSRDAAGHAQPLLTKIVGKLEAGYGYARLGRGGTAA